MTANRRRLLSGAGASLMGLVLAGCDRLNRSEAVQATLARAEDLTCLLYTSPSPRDS